MKLYKIDFTNTIGNNVVTVPTDSEFLVGLGNGDADSTARLFDGETELSALSDKIGDYTCFKFTTDGTPFRKHYKGTISGNNFEAQELYCTPVDECQVGDYQNGLIALPKNINPDDLISDGGTPELTSFQMNVFGLESYSPLKAHYNTTVTYTWNAEKSCFVSDSTFDDREFFTKYLAFASGDSYDTDYMFYYGVLDDGKADSGDRALQKETLLVPAPYTQDIDLLVICDKQSVAYRDFDTTDSTKIVEAVEDSGKFLEKKLIWGSQRYSGDAPLVMADNKDINLQGGDIILNTTSEKEATCLELIPNEETEEVDAVGTINGGEYKDLYIKNAVLLSCQGLPEPINLTNALSSTTYTLNTSNFLEFERTVYDVGRGDVIDPLRSLSVNVDLGTNPDILFKINLLVRCHGDVPQNPNSIFTINIYQRNTLIITLTPSAFGVVSPLGGPTNLATLIGDSSGTALFVELTFNAAYKFAAIKGQTYDN